MACCNVGTITLYSLRSSHLGIGLGQSEAEVVGQGKGIVGGAGKVSAEANGAVQRAEVRDAALNLRTEVAHEALDRPRGGVAQCTDSATLDLFSAGRSATMGARKVKTYVISSNMSISRI